MTNKDLANLIYPNVTMTLDDYEKKYPERNLEEGAVVSRFAPSPTGFVHMGSLLAAFIERKVPQDTNGVFYLRIEDTDQKRSVENGIQGIIDDLKNFDITMDEGVVSETEQKGNYGPYIQSQRKEIYEAFAKHLIEQGLAYPCFCKQEEIDEIREIQEKKKERLGYYGRWAKCRELSNEERIKRINNGEEYIVRLKSLGNFDNKIVVNDLVCGKLEFPENDLDIVLIKSDGLPIYHFAHLVDDHLMRTTHVLRGEEWVSSLPIHIQLFKTFGFKIPKYAHLGLIMKIDENGSRRKLSKRKDPEAAVSYYHEKGIPIYATKLYLMTIANSNFELWMESNPTKTIDEFKFDFKKMSASGSLFDVNKLLNISKNYISKLTALEVYNSLLTWSLIYDKDFSNLLTQYKDFSISILNIEREQKKPRKDYACYSEVKSQIWYMYDELFDSNDYKFQSIDNSKEIATILKSYMEKYFNISDKDTWFNNIRKLCDELGYASDMKDYKENPDKYKGNVADVSTVLRVALTKESMTPDLYEIMRILGKEKIERRYDKFIQVK
ncbi:MAG: glutamate--tRNA ligase [Bacilli bacterium]|nr:glutamate--tRNA ligase [Bacilli bacterium]